jgi:phenylacetate-CoA ligase
MAKRPGSVAASIESKCRKRPGWASIPMDHPTRAALEKLRPLILPDPESQAAFRMQLLFADGEFAPREVVERYQLQRLKMLARHAAAEAPYWRARLDIDAILAAGTLHEALSRIPIQSRSGIIDHGGEMHAATLPAGHTVIGEMRTSGSTGTAVSVVTTEAMVRLQTALTLRAHLWAGRNFTKPIAVLRRMTRGEYGYPEGMRSDRWDLPFGFPFPTGPSFGLNTHQTSLGQQWEWLERVKPSYLLTYPSILRGFAERLERGECAPIPIGSITSISEVVDPELRDLAARYLKAPIYDLYSSEEAGLIAIQCPSTVGYHIQSEVLIVEIADDAGDPCPPGGIGRVLITPLFNFAMPLFRYELGDFAEAGGACACGRGLPVINRILGRRRNLLTLADGRRFWPSLGAKDMARVVQVRQHQFRQTSADVLDVLLVTDDEISPEQTRELEKIVLGRLPVALTVRVQRVAEIPRPASGKYEEFVSLVA